MSSDEGIRKIDFDKLESTLARLKEIADNMERVIQERSSGKEEQGLEAAIEED